MEAKIKYLTESLHSMSPPPSSDKVKQLTKHTGWLFIYTTTAVQYILLNGATMNSTTCLQTVLGMTTRSNKQHKELNELYVIVLSIALNNEELEDEEKHSIQLTLWTVVCAREPMMVQVIVSVLSLQEVTV